MHLLDWPYLFIKKKSIFKKRELTVQEVKKKRTFKCYFCGEEFDTLAGLVRHDLKLKPKMEKREKK